MSVYEIDDKHCHLPSDKTERNFVKHIFDQYNISKQYYSLPLTDKITIDMLGDAKKIYNMRNDMMKLIFKHMVKHVYKNNGRITKCLSTCKDKRFPILNFFRDVIYHDVERLFTPYIYNIEMCRQLLFNHLCFITDKNDVVAFKNGPCDFDKILQGCKSLDDAIIEYNYYSDYDKIHILYEW